MITQVIFGKDKFVFAEHEVNTIADVIKAIKYSYKKESINILDNSKKISLKPDIVGPKISEKTLLKNVYNMFPDYMTNQNKSCLILYGEIDHMDKTCCLQ